VIECASDTFGYRARPLCSDLVLLVRQSGFRRIGRAGIIPLATETAPKRKGPSLRSLTRRLLPLIAFALVLGLVLAGLGRHSRSQLTFGSGRSARGAGSAARAAAADRQGTGVSAAVGTIPGVTQARQSLATLTVAAKPLPAAAHEDVPKVVRLLPADVLVVGADALPAALTGRLRRLAGVAAAVPVDAGRIKVNDVYVNVLGVDPTTFRPFAAKPTAGSTALWNNVAAGGMAISYTMGKQDRLSLAKPVLASGSHKLRLPVAGFGTVGIGGVDAVVSEAVARSLGLASHNAIVISAPNARLDVLMREIRKLTPRNVSVAALVTQIVAGGTTITTGAAGDSMAADQGSRLTPQQLAKFLSAATSRIGDPYVWGDAGPTSFDCSGLVQWSLAQAGVVMPRVAADQARTGPLLPLSQLQPGDLLFYHTDPTAPDYISHVAIYLGHGKMLQAPEPGMFVEVVNADFGAGFAGAIRIDPKVAAEVAAHSPV
jgi:peptidoglycan DL-endopeptidase CwlO